MVKHNTLRVRIAQCKNGAAAADRHCRWVSASLCYMQSTRQLSLHKHERMHRTNIEFAAAFWRVPGQQDIHFRRSKTWLRQTAECPSDALYFVEAISTRLRSVRGDAFTAKPFKYVALVCRIAADDGAHLLGITSVINCISFNRKSAASRSVSQ